MYVDVVGGVQTNHVYANSSLIGSVEGPSVYSIHRDHLDSTRVVSNGSVLFFLY
jgi:hypothetical protein